MYNDDSPSTSATCGQCGLLHHNILHHVRLNGTFRRLCTTCVLRLHPKCFCPACLAVYKPSPPENAVVCLKCLSSSHRTCVPPPVAVRTPCSTCVNPNGLNFDYNSTDQTINSNRTIGLSAARLLVAAAEISSMSIMKAEVDAVMEAEWRAKEASEWRKKAKEAVSHVVRLMEIEKKRRGGNYRVVIDDGNSSFVDDNIGSYDEFSEALNWLVNQCSEDEDLEV